MDHVTPSNAMYELWSVFGLIALIVFGGLSLVVWIAWLCEKKVDKKRIEKDDE